MKKLLFSLILGLIICFSLIFTTNAASITFEPIPDDLKHSDDPETLNQFVVIADEAFYVGSGSTINNLNTEAIAAAFTEAGISVNDLGVKYLTKFIIPDTYNGQTVTYADVNNNKAFKGSVYFKNVAGYVKFPSNVLTINDMNDATSNLRCIDFGENNNISVIPGSLANAAGKLKRLLNMPDNLTKIGSQAFRNCRSLSGDMEGVLYINASTIENKAFDNALMNVNAIIFGENVSSLAAESFSVGELNSVGVKYIEFKGNVENINFSKCEEGTYNGAFYFHPNSGSQRKPYSNLTCIILSHPDNQAKITEGTTTFRDFQPNVYFKSGDNLVFKAHEVGNPVVNYSSYLKAGTLESSCTRCNKGAIEELEPLFEFKGFSVPENGEIAVLVTYVPNFNAINLYESLTKNTVSYGVVAASVDNLGENVAPLDENGNIKELDKGAVIKAPIKSADYAYVHLKIKGFTEEAHKNIMLLMAAYVQILDSENNLMSLNYLQGTQIVNNTFTYVSYSSITKLENS